MEQKFFICERCGNIIATVKESGVAVVCCGENMRELKAGEADATIEKHVPCAEIHGNMVHVKVGSADHPMTDEHYIEWISIQTDQGNQRKCIKPGDKPEATFALVEGDKLQAVYAYCNIHRLWKKCLN